MGIFIFLVLILWFVFIFWLTPKVMTGMLPSTMKTILSPIVFVLLFIAPVSDEIIGGFQFRHLCSENSKVYVNAEKARGGTVTSDNPPSHVLKNFIIPIQQSDWVFKDIKTKEVLVSWVMFDANGGWLSRTGVFLQGNPPITFNGFCAPDNVFGKVFKQFNINVLYK